MSKKKKSGQSERVRRIVELRRSSAARPPRNLSKYNRTVKHRNQERD